MRRHSHRLFDVWRLDSDAAITQLEGVVAKLVQDNREAVDSGNVDDNRTIWVQALRPQFGISINRVEEVIRIYMAALDGTCGVERDLGTLLRVLEAHSGPVDEDGNTISHCVTVLLDGPEKKEEVAHLPSLVGGSGSCQDDHLLLPTDFSRDCGRHWLSAHGRRFLVYNESRGGQKRGPKLGSMKEVVRSVERATRGIVKQAVEANGADATVLGTPRTLLTTRGSQPRASAKMKKFLSLTAAKHQKLEAVVRARAVTKSNHRNPYTVAELNPRLRLRRGRALTAPPKPDHKAPTIDDHNGAIVVASCCKDAVPPTPGYQIRAMEDGTPAAQMIKQLMKAQLIVWDCTWQLDGPVTARHLLSAIVAIGLGKAVLPRPRWNGPRPHNSTALVHYLPAASLEKVKLALVGELVDKHTSVSAALRMVAQRGKSWTIVSDAAAADVQKLSTLTEVRAFLQKSRRVYRSRPGMTSTLIRH